MTLAAALRHTHDRSDTPTVDSSKRASSRKFRGSG